METLTKLMLLVKLMRIPRSSFVQLEKLSMLPLLYANLERCSGILERQCQSYVTPLEVHFNLRSEPIARSNSCAVVRTYTGHGINNLFHCAPNIPHYAKNKAVGTMKAGMVNLSSSSHFQMTDQDTVLHNWTSSPSSVVYYKFILMIVLPLRWSTSDITGVTYTGRIIGPLQLLMANAVLNLKIPFCMCLYQSKKVYCLTLCFQNYGDRGRDPDGR